MDSIIRKEIDDIRISLNQIEMELSKKSVMNNEIIHLLGFSVINAAATIHKVTSKEFTDLCKNDDEE